MTPAFKVLQLFDKHDPATATRDYKGEWVVKGRFVQTLSPIANDYYKEDLPTIPAGTTVQIDFGGDFGMYGIADINGVLHKIKVPVEELHKVDFSDLIAEFLD